MLRRATAVLTLAATLGFATPASGAHFPDKVQKGFDKCLAKGGGKRACKKAALADYLSRCQAYKSQSLRTCKAWAQAEGWTVHPRWKPAAFDEAVAALGVAETYQAEGKTTAMVELSVRAGQCLTFRLDAPGQGPLACGVEGDDALWVAVWSKSFDVGAPDETTEVCFDGSGTAVLSVQGIEPRTRAVQVGRALQVAVGVERRTESSREAATRQAAERAALDGWLRKRAQLAGPSRARAILRDLAGLEPRQAMACEMCREERDSCRADGRGDCPPRYGRCAAAVGVDAAGRSVCASN